MKLLFDGEELLMESSPVIRVSNIGYGWGGEFIHLKVLQENLTKLKSKSIDANTQSSMSKA